MMSYSDLPLWARMHKFQKETTEYPEPQYAILWEDPRMPEDAVKVTTPTPAWLAMAMHGGILPPVEVYWALAYDEAQPDFTHHHRGRLLHETPPMEAMTEEQAMEYLVKQVIPTHVWRDYQGNRAILRIIRRDTIPTDRRLRDAWVIAQDNEEQEEAA